MNKFRALGKGINPFLFLVIPILMGGAVFANDSSAAAEKPPLAKISQSDLPQAVNISRSGPPSSTPLVVTDSGGGVHVIWLEGTGGRRNVFYNSNKTGTWGNGQNVSPDIKIGSSGPWPDFGIDKADKLHYVVTAVSSFPNYEVYYKRYTDGTWEQAQNISNTAAPDSGGSACPTLGLNPLNNECYATWYDDIYTPDKWSLYFTYRSGGSWSRAVSLPVGGGTYTPEMEVDGNGTAHLIWIKRRKGSSVVYYSSNVNPPDENKWTQPIAISGETGKDWCEPDVACDNQGNVCVAWIQRSDGNDEIFARKKSPGGWGSTQNISKTSTSSQLPRVALNKDTGNAYVVWQERAGGNWEIFMNYSAGDAWASAAALTKNATDSITPDIYVDNVGNIHIVYADNVSGGFDIFYMGAAESGGVPLVLYPPINVHMNTVLVEAENTKKNIVLWKKNPDNNNDTVQEYRLYRKQVNQGVSSYNLRAKVGKTTFRFEDTGLSRNLKYSYALTTVNDEGLESDYSNEASEPEVFPPVNISVESSLGEANTKKINSITWERDSHNGKNKVAKYRIFRREESGGSFAAVSMLGGNTYSYKDTGLSTNKKYVYRLTALDEQNRECEPSLSHYEDYVFNPINLILKTIVNEGLYFSEKINQLRWKKSPLNNPVNVVKYIIYRKNAEEGRSAFKPILVTEEKEFEFWDRNLTLDEKYSYVVTAVCDNGAESEFSDSKNEK